LVEVIFDLFAPNEALEFIEANESQRPLTIRTNTLKTKRKDLAKVLI
jgi:ribosomal RNA methyltransferase Nop2